MKNLKLLIVVCAIFLLSFSTSAQKSSFEVRWNKMSFENQKQLIQRAADRLDPESAEDLIFKYKIVIAMDTTDEVNEALGMQYLVDNFNDAIVIPSVAIMGSIGVFYVMETPVGWLDSLEKFKGFFAGTLQVVSVIAILAVTATGVLMVNGDMVYLTLDSCSNVTDICPDVKQLREKYRSDVINTVSSVLELK